MSLSLSLYVYIYIERERDVYISIHIALGSRWVLRVGGLGPNGGIRDLRTLGPESLHL